MFIDFLSLLTASLEFSNKFFCYSNNRKALDKFKAIKEEIDSKIYDIVYKKNIFPEFNQYISHDFYHKNTKVEIKLIKNLKNPDLHFLQVEYFTLLNVPKNMKYVNSIKVHLFLI